MTTIGEKLEYLSETKSLIKSAINTKSPNAVSDTTPFRKYANAILDIEGDEGDIGDHEYHEAVLESIVANGDSTHTTTKLTLTFDKNIIGLRKEDIELGGLIEKISLTKIEIGVYELEIRNTYDGDILVTITPRGYLIEYSQTLIHVFNPDRNITLLSAIVSGTTSSKIRLTFDKPLPLTSINDIIIEDSSVNKTMLLKISDRVYDLFITVSKSVQTTITAIKATYIINSELALNLIYVAPPILVNYTVNINGKLITITLSHELELTFNNIITSIHSSYPNCNFIFGNFTKINNTTYTISLINGDTSGYCYLSLDYPTAIFNSNLNSLYFNLYKCIVIPMQTDTLPLFGVKVGCTSGWGWSTSYLTIKDQNNNILNFTITNNEWKIINDVNYYLCTISINSPLDDVDKIIIEPTTSWPGYSYITPGLPSEITITKNTVEIPNDPSITADRFIMNFQQLKTILTTTTYTGDYYVANDIIFIENFSMVNHSITLHPYNKNINIYGTNQTLTINTGILNIGSSQDQYSFIINGIFGNVTMNVSSSGILNIEKLTYLKCNGSSFLLYQNTSNYSYINHLIITECTLTHHAIYLYNNFQIDIYSIVIINNHIAISNTVGVLYCNLSSNNKIKFINDCVIKNNTSTESYTQSVYCNVTTESAQIIFDGTYFDCEKPFYYSGVGNTNLKITNNLNSDSNLSMLLSAFHYKVDYVLFNLNANVNNNIITLVDIYDYGFYLNNNIIKNDDSRLLPSPARQRYLDLKNEIETSVSDEVIVELQDEIYEICATINATSKKLKFLTKNNQTKLKFIYGYTFSGSFIKATSGVIIFNENSLTSVLIDGNNNIIVEPLMSATYHIEIFNCQIQNMKAYISNNVYTLFTSSSGHCFFIDSIFNNIDRLNASGTFGLAMGESYTQITYFNNCEIDINGFITHQQSWPSVFINNSLLKRFTNIGNGPCYICNSIIESSGIINGTYSCVVKNTKFKTSTNYTNIGISINNSTENPYTAMITKDYSAFEPNSLQLNVKSLIYNGDIDLTPIQINAQNYTKGKKFLICEDVSTVKNYVQLTNNLWTIDEFGQLILKTDTNAIDTTTIFNVSTYLELVDALKSSVLNKKIIITDSFIIPEPIGNFSGDYIEICGLNDDITLTCTGTNYVFYSQSVPTFFHDLTFIGSSTATISYIWLTRNFLKLNNVKVTNFKIPYPVVAAEGIYSRVDVKNSKFIDCLTNTLGYVFGGNITYDNCYFENTNQSNIQMTESSAMKPFAIGVIIKNCIFKNITLFQNYFTYTKLQNVTIDKITISLNYQNNIEIDNLTGNVTLNLSTSSEQFSYSSNKNLGLPSISMTNLNGSMQIIATTTSYSIGKRIFTNIDKESWNKIQMQTSGWYIDHEGYLTNVDPGPWV